MRPRSLSAEKPLAEQAWPEGTLPVVTVLLMAHNHERFVRSALEGILMQRTTFPVQIVAHDDASTDATLEIIREYSLANPQLFLVQSQTENQHSQGNRAVRLMMSAAVGEYVALCEGDDYWTDPSKLQRQVAAMDVRPDAMGIFHRADAKFEESDSLVPGFFGPADCKLEYGIDDLLVGDNFVPTASIMLRRVASDLPNWLGSVPHGDIVILSTAALLGPLLFIDRSMAVYRKHAAGIHSREPTAVQALKCIQSLTAIGAHYGLCERASFRTGIAYRVGQVADEVARYESRIAALEQRHQEDRRTIDRIMRSKTFKLGMMLSRAAQRMKH